MPQTDRPLRIALVGDRSDSVTAHRAIPIALDLEARARTIAIAHDWHATDRLTDPARLAAYDAIWTVPASPYASFDNALAAIRHARETGTPFLGTCGGYQHALVEYARNVLGHPQAGISEIDPDCPMPLVSSLTCALIDETDPVLPEPGGLIDRLAGPAPLTETYRCSFGINPEHQAIFDGTPLRVAARDPDGAIRAMALDGHPFFLGTAFQPERAALTGHRHPIVTGFIGAAIRASRAPDPMDKPRLHSP